MLRRRRPSFSLPVAALVAMLTLAACAPAAPPSAKPAVEPTKPSTAAQAAQPAATLASGQPAAPAAQPTAVTASLKAMADKRNLVVVTGSDITTLDPHMNTAVNNITISFQLFDNLTTRDPDLKLIPQVATEWKTLNDTTWEFKLRSGVKFHNVAPVNGRPFTYLDDAPLERQCVGDVELVISRSETPPAREVSREAVLRHAEVVEELMHRSEALLPAQLGRTFASEDELAAAVLTRAKDLARGLERVRGCVEFGLRVIEPKDGGEERERPASASGAEYMRARLAEVKRYMAQGSLTVEAQPPNDPGSASKGRIGFVDNQVDPTTGTIRLKGTFPNENRRLWPGQFVNVAVTLTTDPTALVVPTTAVQSSQQGQYVFIVTPDQKAAFRTVTVARAEGAETVIEQGLAAGETVVTDGQLRLVPGAPVSVKSGPGAQATP